MTYLLSLRRDRRTCAASVVAAFGLVALVGCASPGARFDAPGFAKAERGFEARGDVYRARVSSDGALQLAGAGTTGVELRTRSIGRGAERDGVATAPELDPDGSISIRRRNVIERLHPEARGVEQSFTFAERPRGQGDLDVRVAIRGGRLVGRTRGGLTLASDLGERLAYREATWVDARGSRTDLTPELDGDEIVIRVDAAVIERSAFPAVLDPMIGDEIDVDEKAEVKVPWLGVKPAIACASTDCLAVWPSLDSGVRAIVGIHLHSDGTFNGDREYFTIADSPQATSPSVSAAGSSYVVTYADGTPGATHVFATNVTSSDATSKPTQLDTADSADGPLIAPLGSELVAVWTEDGITEGRVVSNGAGALALLVSLPGPIIASVAGASGPHDGYLGYWDNGPTLVSVDDIGVVGTPTQLSSSVPSSLPALAAADDGSVLAVWFDDGARKVMGSLEGGAPFLIGDGTSTAFAVAAQGETFWVAMVDDVSGTTTFSAASVKKNGVGAKVTAQARTVALPAPPTGLAVACDGAGCLALLSDATSLNKLRFGPTADSATSPIGYLASSTGSAVLGSDGNTYLVTLTRQDPSGPSYHAIELGPDGKPTPEVAISSFTSIERIVFDGAAYRVVGRNPSGDLIERIADRPGVTSNLLTLPPAEPNPAGLPDAACGPTECIVIDQNIDGIIGRLSGVAFADTALGQQFPKIAGGTDGLIAFGGDEYLTTFSFAGEVSGVLLDKASGVGKPFTIAAAPRNAGVAFDGEDFVAVWAEVASSDFSFHGVRVTPKGKRLGGVVVLAHQGTEPRVASLNDGSSTLFAWTNSAGPSPRACFRRFAAGALVDEETCLDTGSDQVRVQSIAARAPGKALIAYTRATEGLGPRVKVRTLDFGDAIGTKCGDSKDGGATCSTSFCRDGVCCDAPCDEPCRACNASGHCEAVVSKPDPDSCSTSDKKSCNADGVCVGDLGAECHSDKSCVSGHCAHGNRCCSTVCGECETCSENGVCEAMDCGSKVCSAGTCGPCQSSLDCKDGQLCDETGECHLPPLLPTSFSDCALTVSDDAAPPMSGALLLGLAASALALRRRPRSRRGGGGR